MSTRDITSERQFGEIQLFCEDVLEVGGLKLKPDDTKAYCEFKISHAWPSITAYGTAMHPGTVANSYPSMLHQVFNLGHKMRAYDTSPEKNIIPHDQIIGSVVAVDFPKTPYSGWTLASEMAQAPKIHAAAVVHKMAERVPKVMGEHLAGRHKWTVSQEVNYLIGESGYVVMQPGALRGKAAELAARMNVPAFEALGLSYISMADAPPDLVSCYDFGTHAVTTGWGGSPVVLLKGGVAGQVHYQGVGLVRYGAEREAEIARVLASDPAAVLSELDDLGFVGPLAAWVQTYAAEAEVLAHVFQKKS